MAHSDISQVFEADDTLTLPVDITASERRGPGEKNGYSFLGTEFIFLIAVFNCGTSDLITITMTILENNRIQGL